MGERKLSGLDQWDAPWKGLPTLIQTSGLRRVQMIEEGRAVICLVHNTGCLWSTTSPLTELRPGGMWLISRGLCHSPKKL